MVRAIDAQQSILQTHSTEKIQQIQQQHADMQQRYFQLKLSEEDRLTKERVNHSDEAEKAAIRRKKSANAEEKARLSRIKIIMNFRRRKTVSHRRRAASSTSRCKMDLQNPIVLQIVIDLALLAAVIFILWRVNTNIKNPVSYSHKEMMQEIKTLITESQSSAEHFLQAMEQSRLKLKEIAMELDIKEKRVKAILEQSKPSSENEIVESILRDEKISQGKYDEVISMIRKGFSEEETSRKTGFTQPEIGLIIDLYRIKNENL